MAHFDLKAIFTRYSDFLDKYKMMSWTHYLYNVLRWHPHVEMVPWYCHTRVGQHSFWMKSEVQLEIKTILSYIWILFVKVRLSYFHNKNRISSQMASFYTNRPLSSHLLLMTASCWICKKTNHWNFTLFWWDGNLWSFDWCQMLIHDDVVMWNCFLYYWLLAQGI